MSSKKTTTTQQKTTNSLPDWLTSPYQAAVQQAGQLNQQPALSSGTKAVIDRLQGNAAQAGADNDNSIGALSLMAQGNFGNNALTQSANGDFLTADSNPYIRGVAQQGADAAQARINAQFGSAGRSNGSGLYAQNFAQGISDATNNVYAQNYANERQLQQIAAGGLLDRQFQAAGLIPQLNASTLNADQAALQAGAFGDTADMNQLQQYTGILSGLAAPFGQQESNGKQTQSTSGLGSVIGSIAQLGGAAAGLLGGGGLLSGLGGLGGAVPASWGALNIGGGPANLSSLTATPANFPRF